MAVSTIKATIKTAEITGTTGAAGNLDISSVASTNNTVLGCFIPTKGDGTTLQAMGIPFKTASGSWYLKVLSWSQPNYTVIASTSVKATIIYV